MYNNTVLVYSQRRDTIGPLEGATHQGVAGYPGDGSYMILWLQIESDRILQAAYSTIGCPAAQACGSWTVEWVVGKTMAEVLQLSEAQIAAALEGLPAGKEYCPQLAIEALHNALEGGNGYE